MSLEQILSDAIERAWERFETDGSSEPEIPGYIVSAIDNILAGDSAPNRQMLLAIAAGTVFKPNSNPAAIQMAAGVDRRGQAYTVRDVLTRFRECRGLTLKISQDAGVSNQWREPEITEKWVSGRRVQDRKWANAFFLITSWLKETPTADRAKLLLDEVCFQIIERANRNALNYPKFGATIQIAMALIGKFIDTAPKRPDAMESVVTVAARVLASTSATQITVERRDINSPDPIDIVLTSSDGDIHSGIEVTDSEVTLAKIQHEVVPAMAKLGLNRATIVGGGIAKGEVHEIKSYIRRAFIGLQLEIKVEDINIIEAWYGFPGNPNSLATELIWGIGNELDEYSSDGNRRAWLNVLNEYIHSIDKDSF